MKTKQGKSWTENADEIDRLRAQNAELLAALTRIYDVRTDAMQTEIEAASAEEALAKIVAEEGIDRAAIADGAYVVVTAQEGTDSASLGAITGDQS